MRDFYNRMTAPVAVVFVALACSCTYASDDDFEQSIPREYRELSQDEFNYFDKESLVWHPLTTGSKLKDRYSFLGNGETIVFIQRDFITTTGGVYLKVLSVIENECSLVVDVEYPAPISCSIVNKQIGRVSLYLSIDNPSVKKLDVQFRLKDSCSSK